MCCQPGNRTACQLQRPIHIPLLNKDATEMEPCKIRGMTQRLAARTGAGWQEHIFSFRSREQNVLYISSYRSGDNTQNPPKPHKSHPNMHPDPIQPNNANVTSA